MAKILFPLLLLIITFSSCQKERWKDHFTDRIEGRWTYERAKHQSQVFSREDRLEEFKNDTIYFKKDGTLEIINKVDNTYLSGIYSFERTINHTNFDNSSTSARTYQVQISLTDSSSNELYQELWDQFTITKRVIRFQYEEDNKPFYFKLCKQK